jgi:protein TonB
VLTSLVLHVLLLFALPLLKEAKRQLPVRLTARLAAPKPPAPVPPGLEPLPLPPLPEKSRQAAVKAVPKPVVAPTPPAPVLGAERAKPVAEPAFVPPTPAAPPPAEPQGLVARAQPQAAVQASSGPDPGAIARYRLELMDHARRYRKYPRIAQDNNWEGRVELRIEVGENGALAALSVKKGAGRAVLDEAAQAMIRAASAAAAVPPALRGKAFALEIPVDFLLKDEEK